MEITWRQVLEIETFINKVAEQYDPLFMLRWQTTNNGVRVNLNNKYTFSDLYNYLVEKYPEDELIQNEKKAIIELFNQCVIGKKISNIDKELLEINEHQDLYNLDDKNIKTNILNICCANTGSTSFFLEIVKSILSSEKERIQHIDEKNREIIIHLLENFDIESSIFKSKFNILKENIIAFLQKPKFKSYVNACTANKYKVSYSEDEPNIFLKDVLLFAKSEVLEIIRENTSDFFSFKIRKIESPYAEDLRISKQGDINLYTTLNGLLNYDKILEMKSSNILLEHIDGIFNKNFKILSKESITEVNTKGNRYNSSFIIGSNIESVMLYNKFLDDFHKTVLKGTVWFNDDMSGIPYKYLNFHSEEDYEGEYTFSMPFINVLASYHICYLEKIIIEREF